MNNYKDGADDPLEKRDLTTREADLALFGGSDIPHSGRMVAEQIAIVDIMADIRQPRRVFPAGIRGLWGGDPAGVADLLDDWRKLAGFTRDATVRLVMGNGDGRDGAITGFTWVDGFVELCSLASSILREGLTNPITIVRHGDIYMIETGERRWLAHHLLVMYAHDKYKTMAARVVDKFDVYRQASENGSRRPLNAIQMARQLSLLIMDIHAHKYDFQDWDKCVDPGKCDRSFYAQVADGNTFKITGNGQRILDCTGLKSTAQISQYRALLRIDDDLWIDADEQNWPEFKIREIDQERRGVKADKTLTPVKVEGDSEQIDVGDYVRTKGDDCGYVVKINFNREFCSVHVDGTRDDEYIQFFTESLVKEDDAADVTWWERRVEEDERLAREQSNLAKIAENEGIETTAPADGVLFPMGNKFNVGDRVMTPDGEAVVEMLGELPDGAGEWIPGYWFRLEIGDGVFFREDQLSSVEPGSTVDRKTVTEGDPSPSPSPQVERGVDDGSFEIDGEHFDDDLDLINQYIPETHEDAMPVLNHDRPKLSFLMNALANYYVNNDDVPDDEIGAVLDDLQCSGGEIEHEISLSAEQFELYKKDMRRCKMIMRSYLELIGKHIEDAIDEMVDFAAEVHVEVWGSDDYEEDGE